MTDVAMPGFLNIASWQEKSVVNGPGERVVLWLQGCPFRCPGCFNPDFLPFEGGRIQSVEDVASLIESVAGIEGVTFTGGEPFAQAAGLVALASRLNHRRLSLVSYSGYTLTELEEMRDPSVQELLNSLDILIDGRYEAAHRATLPWRGSRNQKVHFLSPTYRHLEMLAAEPHTEIELIIGIDGFASTGIISSAPLRQLDSILKKG